MSAEDLFQREILTVSDLTGRLTDLIETEFSQVWVTGEISTLRRPSSGHSYFVLKDARSQLKAVMFRNQQRYLAFEPEDGQEVLARGRLSVYGPRGEYQIVVEYMEPRGEGALRLAYEKLKAALAAEGLFDEDRKKTLPFLPRRVALVTSPTGAAVRDFIRVARRRFENAHLSIYPVRVQGEGACEEIGRAVVELNAAGDFDLIVLTRGGGSIEDLWAFNEEVVARAVAASEIPVVSAVGHEIDFTIADFAADLRAPTPSAAAEMIFREKDQLIAHLETSENRLRQAITGKLALVRERLSHLRTRLGDPGKALVDHRLRLDQLIEDMNDAFRDLVNSKRRELAETTGRLAEQNPKVRLGLQRARLEGLDRDLARAGRKIGESRRDALAVLARRLDDLSPLAVLKRGYALARSLPDGKPVRDSSETAEGDRLNLVLGKGELDVVVDKVVK